MSSWRDTASAEAEADLDGLLNVAIGFAQQQLAARGEFYPYAAAIGADSQAEMIAAQPDPRNDRLNPADVAAACFGALTDKRYTIRAGAVVSDVRMSDGGEAIRVDLEHVDGHALTVLLPYTMTRLTKKVEFGQLRAQVGQRQIWT
jgi:hypothetical protein